MKPPKRPLFPVPLLPATRPGAVQAKPAPGASLPPVPAVFKPGQALLQAKSATRNPAMPPLPPVRPQQVRVPPAFNVVQAAKPLNAVQPVRPAPTVPTPYRPQAGGAGPAMGPLAGIAGKPLQARLNGNLANGGIQAKSVLPAASLPGAFPRVIQRAQAYYACPDCGKGFDSMIGMNIHRGRWCKGALKVEDDEMSQWSDHSLDSDDEKEVFASSNKRSKQKKLYTKHKSRELNFHSSFGLNEAVKYIGHDGNDQYKANTHLLASGMDSEGTQVRLMINLSTANAMTAYAKRHGAITMPAASNFFGKKQHVHAEMYLIFTLTGGDESQIAGCMEGMHLVVDKPVCQQCYPYVKLAAPSLVDDGTNFSNAVTGRGDFSDTWKSPFMKKFSSLSDKISNPFL